jgi:amino acid transporter
MALFTICAILFLDQLTAAASMGVQSIFWWLLTLVLFFIPYGLITAELGSTYPEEGGIYAWVRRAFGPAWAGRAAWLWWVSVAVWLPSVCILLAVIFSDVFAPEMGQGAKVLMIIALVWLTVGINIVTLNLGKWVPNLGSVLKAIVILALGIGGIAYAWSHGPSNVFTFSELLPHPAGGDPTTTPPTPPTWVATLAFFPVIVYNFLGFELMSGAGEEMKNPARDVPFAIARSGAFIAFFYLFATIGMLLAVPASTFGSHLTDGLLFMFRCMTAGKDYPCAADDPDKLVVVADNALVISLCVMLLYSFVANMVTWSMGANRSAAEAANRGDLPSIFAKLHSTYRTPAHSAVLCGFISTIVLVVFLSMYGSLDKNFSTAFWQTFAFSLVVFLIPYLLLFASFLKLRLADPNTARPYRVPGGYPTAVLLTVVCTLFILLAIGIIVIINANTSEIDWKQAGVIFFGVFLTVVVGEVLVLLARWRQGALEKV